MRPPPRQSSLFPQGMGRGTDRRSRAVEGPGLKLALHQRWEEAFVGSAEVG
jgi:hypothetical protein